MAADPLNSKSPNMQSPPNVSVSKNVVDQQMVVSLGNLSMKKQLCDEKYSDNLESLDSDLVSTTPTGGGLYAGNDPAIPVQGNNEWHQLVTPDSRRKIVYNLVRRVLPDTEAVFNKSLHDFVEYVKQIESDMYKMANSRSEYYHLMAKTDYKIQKEYIKKLQERELANKPANARLQASIEAALIENASFNRELIELMNSRMSSSNIKSTNK